MNRKKTGEWGEAVVVLKLKELGFEIITTNFHTKYGEIDIVAREEGKIVFVEVKTRSNSLYGEAVEAVSRKKISNMIKAAHVYLQDNNMRAAYRIDVATLDKQDNGNWKFRLIRDALV